MATPARSRRPPGSSPPEKRTRNPLYSNILPITHLFLIVCDRNDAYLVIIYLTQDTECATLNLL